MEAFSPKQRPDVAGAADGVARIQFTYDIPPSELGNGRVAGNKGLNLTGDVLFSMFLALLGPLGPALETHHHIFNGIFEKKHLGFRTF